MGRMGRWISLLAWATAATTLAADYLPLEQGNTWTYRDAKTGQSFDVRVGTPAFINQRVYFSLRGYTPQQLFARIAEDGNLYYFDEDLDREILLTAFDFSGGRFDAVRRECPELGKVAEQSGRHEGPAGNWNVLEINYQSYACADAGDELEQFADNIGMVRRVVNTIAGPRTLDLVYARVGRQVIRAGETSSFGLSLAQGEGQWLATLRIEQPADSSLTLLFPSSQEYELELKDTEGRVVWRWSDGQFNIPILHTRQIAGGFSVTVPVPFPPAVPEQDQVYTLEAWLTTAQGQPRFGAATTVKVYAQGLTMAPPSHTRARR